VELLLHSGKTQRQVARELDGQRVQFKPLEKGLPGPAEAGRDRGADKEPRRRWQDNPGTAPRDRISQAAAGDLKKKKHEHTGGTTDQRYAMIEKLSVEFPIKECCVALRVSRSGYYRWAADEPSLRTKANAELIKQIRRLYTEHKGRYGSPRISAVLRKREWAVGKIA